MKFSKFAGYKINAQTLIIFLYISNPWVGTEIENTLPFTIALKKWDTGLYCLLLCLSSKRIHWWGRTEERALIHKIWNTVLVSSFTDPKGGPPFPQRYNHPGLCTCLPWRPRVSLGLSPRVSVSLAYGSSVSDWLMGEDCWDHTALLSLCSRAPGMEPRPDGLGLAILPCGYRSVLFLGPADLTPLSSLIDHNIELKKCYLS